MARTRHVKGTNQGSRRGADRQRKLREEGKTDQVRRKAKLAVRVGSCAVKKAVKKVTG